MQPVDLACEGEHGLAAEGDDDRARRQPTQRALADELERQDALEDLDLGLRERVQHERLGVERPEHEDVAVVAREQQPRPRRAALGIVGPLHLVEHEHLARARRHLDRAADDRRRVVDALLARDEADGIRRRARPRAGGAPPARASAAARRRRRGRAPSGPRARGSVLPELVGPRCATTDSGCDPPLRQRDLDRALGAPDRGARRPPRAPADGAPSGSGASPGRVPVCVRRAREGAVAQTADARLCLHLEEAAQRHAGAERSDAEADEHQRERGER